MIIRDSQKLLGEWEMSEQIWTGFMIGWVTAGIVCCLMFWLMTRPLSKKWDAMVKCIQGKRK